MASRRSRWCRIEVASDCQRLSGLSRALLNYCSQRTSRQQCREEQTAECGIYMSNHSPHPRTTKQTPLPPHHIQRSDVRPTMPDAQYMPKLPVPFSSSKLFCHVVSTTCLVYIPTFSKRKFGILYFGWHTRSWIDLLILTHRLQILPQGFSLEIGFVEIFT